MSQSKGNMFISRRVMACAISIVIALVGFISLNTLPVEQYPDIAPPTIQITTNYDGADANTIMKSVITPIEEAINGVQDMTYIQSTASSTGEVDIKVYFKQGTNADMAAVNVQNRLSKATPQLPDAVNKVGVTVEKTQNSILQMGALISTDGKFDQDFLANYIDINIKPRLQRISGIGNVTNLGNTYSLRIWMKPDVMARYGLTPDDVFAAIGSQSLVVAAGSLGEKSDNTYQYNMEYRGLLNSTEEFNDIVLKTKTTGQTLRLGDVADVELGAMSYTFTSQANGNPGVMFIINQAAGANATQVNANIDKLMEDLSSSFPAGVKYEKMMSSNDFLFAAIHNVVETLIIAILLVILVVYFFLQSFKATIIPSLSIIVSILGTFAIVKMAGFSMNILTLFALVLAIGTVVDDAIVVVEAVMTKFETGYKSPFKATRDAMSEVSTAVISCTLVFMAVFIPVTFMPGTSGQFFTQFGVTIASSVGLSCVSAMTLCPALCAILMRPNDEGKAKKNLNYYTKLAYEASYNAVASKYKKSIGKFIGRTKTVWILLVASCLLLAFFMKSLPNGLVPQEDQGVILAEIRTAPGYTLQQTDAVLDKVEAKIKKIPELQSYVRVAGYGMVSGGGSSYGTFVVRLKPWDDRKGINHMIDLVIARLYYDCEDIKEAVVLPFQMPQIPGYGTSNDIELVLQDQQGGDMSVFYGHAQKFLAELQKRKEVSAALSSYSESFPKYKAEINATQCDISGISPQQVLNTLGSYCGGAFIGNYNQFGKVYRIIANAAPEYRLDPTSLSNMFVKVGNGSMAPLSQFVTLVPAVGSSTQRRFNLFQSITCSVTPAEGFSDGDVQNAIAEVAEEVMPAGYGYEYGGMSRELAENSKGNMTGIIYGICIFLIYLILGCLYESWLIPLAVLFSVPFGLMGSFGVSYLLGLENNIYLQTGVIMLIGLLAKTAILITEFAVARHKQGLSIVDAALQAAEERLRPILMTVACMVIGMIPLIVAGGAGANGNRSLAIGVTGGMIVGTIALVYVVPVFYIIFQKLQEKVSGPIKEDDNEEE